MKDWIKLALALSLLAVLLGGGVYWGVSCWRECRRLHPWWYCAGEGGRR